jgi:hypothetical protein
MVTVESHRLLSGVYGCYVISVAAMEVNGFYGKSMVAIKVTCCYGKTIIAYESQLLLWQVTGSYGE